MRCIDCGHVRGPASTDAGSCDSRSVSRQVPRGSSNPERTAVQTTLGQFNETQSQDTFALQNSKLLKVRLDQVMIQAKAGSMVAYQGNVTFEHAGSGGMARFVKKAMTNEGQTLMKVTGQGEGFLADMAQDTH